MRGLEHVGRDDFFQQAMELGIGQADPIQGLELLAEVELHRRAVADVGPQGVFEFVQLFDQFLFDRGFADTHDFPVIRLGSAQQLRRIRIIMPSRTTCTPARHRIAPGRHCRKQRACPSTCVMGAPSETRRFILRCRRAVELPGLRNDLMGNNLLPEPP